MKKIGLVFAVLLLMACGDDSSSVISSSDPESSSAEKQKSSSSAKELNKSSESRSSSSTKSVSSSSEKKAKSSSSAKQPKSSSSSADKDESSSSAAGSSSSFVMPVPCKTETEDDCEYGELKDERDGKTYKTVKFGNQWWMAENLNYADSAKTPSLKGKSWCYGDEPDNCAKYGRLYTWAAAIDSVALATDSENPQDCGYMKSSKNILPDVVHGICPDGWHLPDYRDFSNMLVHVGGYSIAGTVLKSQSGWNEGGNGTDTFGFNVLPAGIRLGNGSFDGLGDGTDFWSATESDLEQAFSLYASYENEYSGVMDYAKNYAFSVRCVKD
jgi:Fibrobacter succinogenes major domain (Fib_succ_major).